jgi:hypothetical protein
MFILKLSKHSFFTDVIGKNQMNCHISSLALLLNYYVIKLKNTKENGFTISPHMVVDPSTTAGRRG